MCDCYFGLLIFVIILFGIQHKYGKSYMQKAFVGKNRRAKDVNWVSYDWETQIREALRSL